MPRSKKKNDEYLPGNRNTGRRQFMAGLAAVPVLGILSPAGHATAARPEYSRSRVRALLVSATTIAGHKSLEHAQEHLKELYSGIQRILLINFASLPPDRDAYAARMQRDFSRIDGRFKVDSLHRASIEDAVGMARDAEAVYVSGGNTFLLLRELYDRSVVDLLRKRIFDGMPYAGSSAGSNIGGSEIGTTNDFPLVDVPTRRSLGIMPACYNPHHPDRAQEAEYNSRQYKIGQYGRYHPETPVIGINNGGMVLVHGDSLSLRGELAEASVQLGARGAFLNEQEDGGISQAIHDLRDKAGKETS